MNGMVTLKMPEFSNPFDEYQEVTYLQGSGSQYIQLSSVKLTNPKIETELYIVSRADRAVFGANLSSDNTQIWALDPYISASMGYYKYNSSSWQIRGSINIPSTTWVVVSMDSVIKVASNQYSSGGVWNTEQIVNLTFLSGYSARYKRIKIYSNSNIVAELVPCYRIADNVAGMYDLVNNQFYTNAGTGTFIVGEPV